MYVYIFMCIYMAYIYIYVYIIYTTSSLSFFSVLVYIKLTKLFRE